MSWVVAPAPSFETRMLLMADRLFAEFDDRPVREVLDAISDARRRLRDSDGVAMPEQIEPAARAHLRSAGALAS